MTVFLLILALLSLCGIVATVRASIADGYRPVPTRPEMVARLR